MSDNLDFEKVADGVWRMKIVFVNIYMVELPDGKWVLIDAGLKGSASKIFKMADWLFPNRKPEAIILTHGHFDHVGALHHLLKRWEVPVYAHAMELPYLTGAASYPPPDPGAGGGLMTCLSFMYPNRPINLGVFVKEITPQVFNYLMKEWRYISTPGHSPGHISLFREKDRLLIAGDAFVTTKQESVLSVISQKLQISGPPKYFTPDWEMAAASVARLKALDPEIAATGHGKPMRGAELKKGIEELVWNFNQKAKPQSGRYVNNPAVTNLNGVVKLPPETFTNVLLKSTLFALAAYGIFQVLEKVNKTKL